MMKRQKTLSPGRNPEIQIRKVITATEHGLDRFRQEGRACHTRTPDIGIGIEVVIPRETSCDVVYYGEYLGHGQSKTAFELHRPGKPFHGKILKVAQATNDMEPHVFVQASALGLTTPILYNCTGRDGTKQYHCWITERAIPLNTFCRYEDADRQRCSLAAFHCLLRAASCGLYLSDCHFFNFGVRLTDNATEHVVVIIDAGSRGIHPDEIWQKSKVNTSCMQKFWRACLKESATNEEIEKKWRGNQTLDECLLWAEQKWLEHPMVTNSAISIAAARIKQVATERFQRKEAQSTSGYKIMEIVGRFAGENHWDASFALTCYRAARNLDDDLTPEETDILDELYSRITSTRDHDTQLTDVMAFWAKLQTYREHEMCSAQSIKERYNDFLWYEVWPELTNAQQHGRNWRSVAETIVHKRTGWRFVAKAILQTGLPKLQPSHASADATEYVTALGEFAHEFAEWLLSFARCLLEYKQTANYQRARHRSDEALERKQRR